MKLYRNSNNYDIAFIDSSYTFEAIWAKDLKQVIDSRTFGIDSVKVLSIHPTAFRSAEQGIIRSVNKVNSRFVFLQCADVFGLGKNRFMGLLLIIFFWFRVCKLCKNRNIGVIQLSDLSIAGFFGFALARILNKPYFVRLPVKYVVMRQKNFLLSVLSWCRRYIMRNSEFIVTPNKIYVKQFLEDIVRNDSVFDIGYFNYVDKRHFLEPESPSREPSVFIDFDLSLKYVVCVSRLEPVKRVADVLLIFERISKQLEDIRLLIVGDGYLRSELESKSVRLGLGRKVEFLGEVDQGTLSWLLPRCSLCVSPITGRSLIEVMLAECAIVAFDCDWQAEIISDNHNGRLVSSENLDEAVTASIELLTHSKVSTVLGKNARKTALDRADECSEQMDRVSNAILTLLKAKRDNVRNIT